MDALALITAQISIYIFGFTLVGLLIGVVWMRHLPLIGSWFRWMLPMYFLIKVIDWVGEYQGLAMDPWFFHSRQTLARCIIGWSVWYCFLWGFYRLRAPEE